MKTLEYDRYDSATARALTRENTPLALLIIVIALVLSTAACAFTASSAYASEQSVCKAPAIADSPASADLTLAAQATSKQAADVKLYDLNGTTGSLHDAYQGKNCIIIAGRYGCANTQSAVSQASVLLGASKYDDVEFLVFDIDDDASTFGNYRGYQANRLHFFTGADYNGWAWSTYVSNGGSYGTVTLPFLFAVDTEGRVLLAETGPRSLSGFIDDARNAQAGGFDDEPAVVSPNVTVRSQKEIIARMAQDDVMLAIEDKFATDPVYNSEMGELSSKTKKLGLGMLNTIRFIAGLDDVTLDETYGKKAQAAAFVDEAIGIITHHPDKDASQPAGMSNKTWELGCDGASHSNLASDYANLSVALVDGWMSDADPSNVSLVGHRRWCLNPNMAATGFGATFRMHAMYSFDNSGAGGQSNVVWPAQNMPYELFGARDPWSISVGTGIGNPLDITVTLTKKNDGKVWKFAADGNSFWSLESGKCFFVDGNAFSYPGQPGCIIFRPNGVSYKAGDEFHVEAANVNGTTIAYDVKFFEGFAGYHSDDTAKQENPVTITTNTITAKTKAKTKAKAAAAFTIFNAKGKVTYTKLSGHNKISVSKTGKVTIKKGLSKGSVHYVNVRVSVAGNDHYKPATKDVVLKVMVK